MKAVHEWLLGLQAYDEGAKLYQQHGTDPLLKKLFKEGYTAYKAGRLKEALAKLLPGDEVTVYHADGNFTVKPIMVPAEEEAMKIKVESLAEDNRDLSCCIDDVQGDVELLRNDHEDLAEKVKTLEMAPRFRTKGWPHPMDATVQELHDQWQPLFLEKQNIKARIYDVAKAGTTDPVKKKEAGAMAHRIFYLRDACLVIYNKRDYYLLHKKLPEEAKPMELSTNALQWPTDIKNYERYIREYKVKLRKDPNHKTAPAQIAKYEWAIAELKKRIGHAV